MAALHTNNSVSERKAYVRSSKILNDIEVLGNIL